MALLGGSARRRFGGPVSIDIANAFWQNLKQMFVSVNA
jgi:hypothetical protein